LPKYYLQAISILLFISNFGIGGAIGNAVSSFFFGVFGLIAYIFPVVINSFSDERVPFEAPKGFDLEKGTPILCNYENNSAISAFALICL